MSGSFNFDTPFEGKKERTVKEEEMGDDDYDNDNDLVGAIGADSDSKYI